MPPGIRPSDTMTAHFTPVRPDDRPHVRAIEALIARHGVFRVALAVVNVAFRRRPVARRFETDLSRHIRRDIGLGPDGRGRAYWDL